MKRPLIILTGPTAVGKTSLSIKLAKAVNAEIISADSMQVYKYMDIGTAKITEEEKMGVPHYMIDEFEPDEEFNVFIFKQKVDKYIEEIYQRGHIPMIVGGTGFYIQSIYTNVEFTETDTDHTYREELIELAKEKGNQYIHDMLKKVDPVSAENIHMNNVKRVARALEYYKQTGELMSKHNEEQSEKESPYNYVYFVLNDDREVLYNRINERIDKMVEDGLLNEVESLLKKGYNENLVSMQGLGYKEIVPYIKGECTLLEALYILKRDTRHFAKRQLTWFRREPDVTMLDISQYGSREKVYEKMLEILKEREITK